MKLQKILPLFSWCAFVNLLILLTLLTLTRPQALAAQYDFKNFQLNPAKRALDDSNPILDTILEYLNQNYQSIGHNQATNITGINDSFDLGSKNFSGFTWQKPMGSYLILANRQLAPDLFHDTRWIVSDTLTFYIDAFSYLKNLDESGVIDITKTQLASFAGIKFKREYRYDHFADTYVEGLTSDYSKLFLSFLKFRNLNITDLAPYEYLTKEDFISFNAGVGAYIPVYSGVSLNAGILVSFNKISKVTIQSLGPEDIRNPDESLRISLEKVKGKYLSAQALLAVDFFELLKITLLSYEHDYSYEEAYKMHLSFYDQDLASLSSNTPLHNELKRILRLKRPDINIIKHHIVSHERRIKENQTSHYRILILGKLKKKETEHVTIQKDGVTKNFFRHQTESIKYIKGFFSFLLEGLKRFINVDLISHYKAARIRTLSMEYEGTQGLSKSTDESVDSEEDLSIKVSHVYSTKNTLKESNEIFKKYAIRFLTRFTSVPIDVTYKLYKDELIGPVKITSTGHIHSDGISSFNQLPGSYIERVNAHVCKLNLKDVDNKDKKHTKRYRCFRKLNKLYYAYIQEYHAQDAIKLWKLKEYLFKFVKHSSNKNDLKWLFGRDGIFVHGTFSAFTNDNHQFLTYFRGGNFQGLGIIDNYIRGSVIRSPASITE